MQQYLEIGRIVAPHGVTGEMKLELWCDSVAFLSRLPRVYRTALGEGEMRVAGLRPHKNMGLLRLEGVNDMDAARAMVGRVLYIDRADVRLPQGTFFIQDLLGCRVLDADTGACYGTVSDISHPAAQDIYTVKAPNGKEYMFPGVDAFLKERNPPEGYITVTPIPGLLDDGAASEREDG